MPAGRAQCEVVAHVTLLPDASRALAVPELSEFEVVARVTPLPDVIGALTS
jgi:hypothetical protein